MHPCTKRLSIGSGIVVAIIAVMFVSIKTHYHQQRMSEEQPNTQTFTSYTSEVNS